MKINIKYLKDIVPGVLASSKLLLNDIVSEHQKFFINSNLVYFSDKRTLNERFVFEETLDPVVIERWQHFEQQYLRTDRISKFWITRVDDAVVYPPYGIVRVGNTIVKDTIRVPKMLQSLLHSSSPEDVDNLLSDPDFCVEVSLPEESSVVHEHSFVLGNGLFDNYFNWTLRYLSKVSIYQRADLSSIVIPDSNKSYIKRSLSFFGVTERECIKLSTPLLFRRLTISSSLAIGRYELSPLLLDNLRDHISVKSLPLLNSSHRLYIPRRSVKIRRISNEGEVDRFFKDLKFEVFDNSVYSIAEQIAAFKSADLIVAVHGAGLTNIVYCRPGTVVIEITPIGYDQGVTSYRSLSDMFDLRYFQIFAKSTSPSKNNNPCNSDVEVNLGEVRSLMDLLFSE
jgi:hypothetical protein